jgi:small multidrug resistance family-3 protein
MYTAIKSLLLFVTAAICEIGGGYLVWLWLKENKPMYYGFIGAFVLALYGVVAALQTASFGRVYVAYGGIFILMALVWACLLDNFKPDKYDVIGTCLALAGVCISLYTPRI